MHQGTKIILVALAAGLLGVIASLASTGPGPLLRTEVGQRALNMLLSTQKPPTGIEIAERGQRLPTLTLQSLTGTPMTLPSAYAGRPVLINLWATWCAPCRKEMPELQRFSAEQADNGIQVVGIALDDTTSVQAFLQRMSVAYPILLDTPGPTDAGVRLGNPAGVLPYSVLVSADGRLLKTRIGPFA